MGLLAIGFEVHREGRYLKKFLARYKLGTAKRGEIRLLVP
jgi:hypothetical protein